MKIQVGKRYVTRDGRVTGKVKGLKGSDRGYAFTCMVGHTYLTYTENGEYYGRRTESANDLVAEKPSFWKQWLTVAIAAALLIAIGATINSMHFMYERNEWYEAQRMEWQGRWDQVERTQRQTDSVLNEAWQVYHEAIKKILNSPCTIIKLYIYLYHYEKQNTISDNLSSFDFRIMSEIRHSADSGTINNLTCFRV